MIFYYLNPYAVNRISGDFAENLSPLSPVSFLRGKSLLMLSIHVIFIVM